MRRVVSVVIAVVFVVSMFTGCGRSIDVPVTGGSQKVRVVTSNFPPYDFVRAIAGEQVELNMLLPPASESHSFEPTPQDIIKIQNSDLFIYVGGESDHWVSEILSSVDTSAIEVMTLMDCVEVVQAEVVEGMQDAHVHDHDDDHDHDGDHDHDDEVEEREYDEHVWTSPKNAKQIVQKISDSLCQLDEANADLYKTNTTAYLAQLEALDAAFQNVVDNAVRKTLVFGDRFPFRYFVEHYGLDYYAAFSGCSMDSNASAKTIKFLIDKVNDEKIPLVFHIELSNEKLANLLAEETGAQVRLFHSAHNVTKSEFEAGKTYLDFMQANVEVLEEALI